MLSYGNLKTQKVWHSKLRGNCQRNEGLKSSKLCSNNKWRIIQYKIRNWIKIHSGKDIFTLSSTLRINVCPVTPFIYLQERGCM